MDQGNVTVIKERLRSQTVKELQRFLMIPDPHVPFVVEVDASTTGVGAMLSQQFGEPPHLQPCAYYSKKLSSAEQNYDIRNQELLAIKLSHPSVVISCHKNLQYIRDVKWLNLRQARWAMFFYKIPLHYLPSRESKLQGGCPFPTCTHYPIQAWANSPSSPHHEHYSVEHRPGHPSRHSDWTCPAGRPRRENVCSHLTIVVPSWLSPPSTGLLNIQAANGPCRSSKAVTGGSVCPVMSSGTSVVAQSMSSPRLLISSP